MKLTPNESSFQRDRERDEAKKREEKEEQLRSQTEVAKLSSFADLVPDEPATG